jgi:hypothetical protein
MTEFLYPTGGSTLREGQELFSLSMRCKTRVNRGAKSNKKPSSERGLAHVKALFE